MDKEDFRFIESALGHPHREMAEALGISEVSVKRYATGAQEIPPHIAKLAVGLLLIQQEQLQKKFGNLLDKYHGDT
jgi:hypothetical protein